MQQRNVEIFARYIHIAGKLHRTIIINHKKLSELSDLQDKVVNVPLDKTQPNPFLHHLEQISQVLKENSHTYIVRHLHNNFHKDVEALAGDGELLNLEYYLNLVD